MTPRLRCLLARIALVSGLLGGAGFAWAQTSGSTPAPPGPVNAGPYVPTPTVIVNELMRIAEIKATDFVIDLGSGDGRLVITAAKRFGASGLGIDIQDALVKLANENAAKEGVADRVKFVKGDLFEADLREASVITLYLLPNTVTKLVPKFLAELKPGTRIVSHDYPLVPWEHDRAEQFEFEEKIKISGTTRTVLYRYVIPAAIAGEWDARLPAGITRQPARFSFTRDPALRVSGTATVDGKLYALERVSLRGDSLSADLPDLVTGKGTIRLRGTVSGGSIRGTAEMGAQSQPWQATLRPATR